MPLPTGGHNKMYRLAVLPILLAIAGVRSDYKFETKWFTVPLDHFGYQRNETFKIKYLVNDTFWDSARGPIFFYTGNEGQIELFAQHTGFIWEIAEEFRAKVVFAEHRYYGKSIPFGDKSLDNDHIGYLSSGQALADYAELINYLQGNEVTPKYPVIAFGGSYGGMLAAYFRIKYPHIVNGAIAASAPVHMFPGMRPCGIYYTIVTSSFAVADQKCVDNIRKSWKVIRDYAKSANDSQWLKKTWKICDHDAVNATTADTLVEFLQSMYETLAMVNYHFPANFLVPLPAYPVRVACQHLNKNLEGKELLEGIGKVLQLYTNYDGKSSCVDFMKGSDYGNLDASGWAFQACTEMVMPMCTNNVDDMFEASPWNYSRYSEQCHKTYNVRPQPDAAKIEYGGSRLQAASNIVFSNGLLDPWAAGGILNSISDTVTAVLILDGAHHVDLMPSDPADPPSVLGARAHHKRHIHQWIDQFWILQQNSRKKPANHF